MKHCNIWKSIHKYDKKLPKIEQFRCHTLLRELLKWRLYRISVIESNNLSYLKGFFLAILHLAFIFEAELTGRNTQFWAKTPKAATLCPIATCTPIVHGTVAPTEKSSNNF